MVALRKPEPPPRRCSNCKKERPGCWFRSRQAICRNCTETCAGCGLAAPTYAQGAERRSRLLSWCSLCHAPFRGHPKCADAIRRARAKHEAACTRVTIVNETLRCE